jgi:hypothetical protein
MKKILVLLPLLLAGCLMARTVETGLSGCSQGALRSLGFFAGNPSSGDAIPAEFKGGMTVWNFGYDAGDIFAVCEYVDGEKTEQKLPASITSCHATADFSTVRCKGHI